MSDLTTIARPYAKALFELALSTKQLSSWSEALAVLAETLQCPEAVQFVSNPTIMPNQQVQFLLSVVTESQQSVDVELVQGFLALLAINKRILLISEIAVQYEHLRAEQEKTLVVNVYTFSPLSDAQQQQLMNKLMKRLDRRIALEVSIDSSLLGGALIQAGDLVIDGSVRGQLSKLASTLAA